MRAMRLIIMFDLPSVTNKEMKYARKWHKFLAQNGFIMMTESVYSRLVMNKSISEGLKKLVKANIPPKGAIQLLEVTEKQFSSMDYLLGEIQNKIIDSIERYVEL
jgi:CRISPR-associated protein Cas2